MQTIASAYLEVSLPKMKQVPSVPIILITRRHNIVKLALFHSFGFFFLKAKQAAHGVLQAAPHSAGSDRERGLRALLWIIPVSSSFKSMGAATLGFELYKTKQEFAAQTEALVR